MRGEKRRTRPCCRGSGVFRGAGLFPLAQMSKVPNMVVVVPAMDGPGLSQLDSWADIDKIGISGGHITSELRSCLFMIKVQYQMVSAFLVMENNSSYDFTDFNCVCVSWWFTIYHLYQVFFIII